MCHVIVGLMRKLDVAQPQWKVYYVETDDDERILHAASCWRRSMNMHVTKVGIVVKNRVWYHNIIVCVVAGEALAVKRAAAAMGRQAKKRLCRQVFEPVSPRLLRYIFLSDRNMI